MVDYLIGGVSEEEFEFLKGNRNKTIETVKKDYIKVLKKVYTKKVAEELIEKEIKKIEDIDLIYEYQPEVKLIRLCLGIDDEYEYAGNLELNETESIFLSAFYEHVQAVLNEKRVHKKVLKGSWIR